ncbi:spore-associated protein A [Nonomuraea sp. NPDC003709]|uniref:spore-associated protein A n=1 Tax=Nonomuraea sp. NPDC003709 TaxID=3154450 RepID=UPI0033BB9B32
MQMRTKLAALVSAATVAASLMAGATPASAAGPCGSGYTRVGVYAIPATGTRVGTLEVHYNSSSRKNCALTYGYGSTAGTTTRKSVKIMVSGGGWWNDVDEGNYAEYAGPVYVSAADKCIDVEAGVKGESRLLSGVHCG